MTIMYRTSCITQKDIGIIFVPDYINKVEKSHTMTLKECIDLYCNDFNINYDQYYLECKMWKD